MHNTFLALLNCFRTPALQAQAQATGDQSEANAASQAIAEAAGVSEL